MRRESGNRSRNTNMKKTAIILAGIVLAGVLGFTIARNHYRNVPSPESALAQAQEQASQTPESAPVVTAPAPATRRSVTASSAATSGAATATPVTSEPETKPTKSPVSLVFNQALDTLTSPQAAFAQRQAAFKQLKDAGQLDKAITELEQRATAEPQAPSYPAALGQAYLQKAGSIQDVREQGILGMKADQTFEAALQLDPNNWDARFWKATAMTYWPVMLGKSNEVIENFATLITQQESQSPQPHFAQTYTQLGDYYQKLGHADYAQQIYQRGAAIFPENQDLRTKLAAR
jgi:cytochrome c-type biogenesis protein CcmH/NrfG